MLFAFVFAMLLASCKKETVEQKKKDENMKVSPLAMQGGISQEPLTLSIISIGDYFNQQDEIHEGELLDYMISNPDYTLEELDSIGYIDASIVLDEIDFIESEILNWDGEQLEDLVIYISSTSDDYFDITTGDGLNLYISGSVDEAGFRRNPDGFVLIRVIGLLSGEPCVQFLFWEWGRGC